MNNPITDPKIIDGRSVSKEIISEVKEEVAVFSGKFRPPGLRVVIVGEDPASRVYVRNKIKTSSKCGIESELIELPDTVSERELLETVQRLNGDPGIDGILVQLPLPDHIEPKKVIERISPFKDVDGIHPFNLGKIVEGEPQFVPCTPMGIIELLKRYDVKVEGKNAVVIGRSLIVGKPIALILASKTPEGNATVTMCHSRTRDLFSHTRMADIVVSAVGDPEFIKGEDIKEGAVVIDVGVNRVDDKTAKKGYRLTGDFDFDSVYPKASLITPVPRGVGPMTVAMLMKNTLKAAEISYSR